MKKLLHWINSWPLWKQRCRVWGFALESVTFDRLLNLWLHKFNFMGEEERRFFQEHVKQGMHVVDVGGNQGLYACLLAKLIGPDGSLISVEPDPRLFACLSGNLERNGFKNAQCVQAGLGEKPAQAKLFRGAFNSGDNRLRTEAPAASGSCVEVNLVPGDEVLKDRRVDFMKIDVQGFEPSVIAGLGQTLAANPGIQIYFEFWPKGLREAGFDPGAFLRHLTDLGFGLQLCLKDRLEPIQPDDERLQIKDWSFVNLLAQKTAL